MQIYDEISVPRFVKQRKNAKKCLMHLCQRPAIINSKYDY